MVQELIHDLTEYAGCMVQYLDDCLFKRHLLSTLRPSLQKKVLHREIISEFSSIQEILEKYKDIKDSSQYNIRCTRSHRPSARLRTPEFRVTSDIQQHATR